MRYSATKRRKVDNDRARLELYATELKGLVDGGQTSVLSEYKEVLKVSRTLTSLRLEALKCDHEPTGSRRVNPSRHTFAGWNANMGTIAGSLASAEPITLSALLSQKSSCRGSRSMTLNSPQPTPTQQSGHQCFQSLKALCLQMSPTVVKGKSPPPKLLKH